MCVAAFVLAAVRRLQTVGVEPRLCGLLRVVKSCRLDCAQRGSPVRLSAYKCYAFSSPPWVCASLVSGDEQWRSAAAASIFLFSVFLLFAFSDCSVHCSPHRRCSSWSVERRRMSTAMDVQAMDMRATSICGPSLSIWLCGESTDGRGDRPAARDSPDARHGQPRPPRASMVSLAAQCQSLRASSGRLAHSWSGTVRRVRATVQSRAPRRSPSVLVSPCHLTALISQTHAHPFCAQLAVRSTAACWISIGADRRP